MTVEYRIIQEVRANNSALPIPVKASDRQALLTGAKGKTTIVLKDKLKQDAPYVNPDFVALPRPVVSARFREVLEGFAELNKITYRPVSFEFLDYDHEYYLLGNIPKIECVDFEQSKGTFYTKKKPYSMMNCKKLVLDESRLAKTPDASRQLVELSEGTFVFMFSASIADALEAAKLAGFRFYPVDEWSTSLPAKDPALTIKKDLKPKPT